MAELILADDLVKKHGTAIDAVHALPMDVALGMSVAELTRLLLYVAKEIASEKEWHQLPYTPPGHTPCVVATRPSVTNEPKACVFIAVPDPSFINAPERPAIAWCQTHKRPAWFCQSSTAPRLETSHDKDPPQSPKPLREDGGSSVDDPPW